MRKDRKIYLLYILTFTTSIKSRYLLLELPQMGADFSRKEVWFVVNQEEYGSN